MKKRFQEVVMYKDHLFMHGVMDTLTGKFTRHYDMENEETDRLMREKNIRAERNFPGQMPADGTINVIREWD